MQNEWVEANEFLKQSQAVPSTWRALEAAEQPQEVRTKCADLNIVSAWRRKEVEASYRAMLQEYRSVDLVSARVKNHLAVASYAWAYTTDANAVEMIEDCIADVAKLCRPALCVLADATRTKSACAALGDINNSPSGMPRVANTRIFFAPVTTISMGKSLCWLLGVSIANQSMPP